MGVELNQSYINRIKKIIERYIQDGAVFARYLECGRICEAEKAAYVALLYPEEFDIYFTKCGWEGGGDYIIAKHATPIERVYDQLMGDDEEAIEDYPYDTFIYEVYKLDENGIAEPKSIGEIKESQKDGFFLDEAAAPNKIKQKYTYAGPVYYTNPAFKQFETYRTYWEDETEATSAPQALRNLTSKFKTKSGFKQNTNYILNPYYLSCADEPVNSAQPASYCDKCGTQLNDGGTCPVCDDGEADY